MSRRLSTVIVLIVLCNLACVCSAQPAAVAEPSSAIQPVPREGKNWQNRHARMNKRVAEGNVDLIFIGDSITQGWEKKGREIWEKFYAKRNAANLGISGDRTQHVLWRLANGNIEGISPKLAVVMIGTNNSSFNSSEEIADGVTEIVQMLRKELPETKVLLLAIFTRGEDAENKPRQINEGTNAIIAELHDGEMVHYLDINAKFLTEDGKLPRDIMPDLLHLNANGYSIWAEAIESSVKELMGKE